MTPSKTPSKTRKLLARTMISTALFLPAAGCDLSYGAPTEAPSRDRVAPTHETERATTTQAGAPSSAAAALAATLAAAEAAAPVASPERIVDQVVIGNGKYACYAEPSAQEIAADEVGQE